MNFSDGGRPWLADPAVWGQVKPTLDANIWFWPVTINNVEFAAANPYSQRTTTVALYRNSKATSSSCSSFAFFVFPSASGRFHIVWHRSGFQRSDFPSPQNPSTHFCSKCNKWLTASTNFLWCLIFPESGFHLFKSGKDPKRRICNLTENIWKPRNHSPIAVCPLSRCRKLTWNWIWFIIFGSPCFYTLAIWLVCIWDLHIYEKRSMR